MEVTVKLFGTLQQNRAEYDVVKGLRVQLAPGATVGKLLEKVGLSECLTCIITINHKVVNRDEKLADWAVLHIFQIASGG
jgi:sulfur carrier protein ThiS